MAIIRVKKKATKAFDDASTLKPLAKAAKALNEADTFIDLASLAFIKSGDAVNNAKAREIHSQLKNCLVEIYKMIKALPDARGDENASPRV